MSKKHFIALADHIRLAGHLPGRVDTILECYDIPEGEKPGLKDLILRTVADELADFCRSQNGRFDRERWLGYINGECGPNGGTVRKPSSSAA